MIQLLTVTAVTIQKSTLIEVFLILRAVLYMPQSIKESKKSFKKRIGLTDRIKLENCIFSNAGFLGASMTLVQQIIRGLEKYLLLLFFPLFCEMENERQYLKLRIIH